MAKPLKLFVSIFVGFDLFLVLYFGLSQLRFTLFGEGQIPGGGSALDMALFLIPIFLAYVAGDRLFYFLTYKERKASQLARPPTPPYPALVQPQGEIDETERESQAQPVGSVWEERNWDDAQRKSEK